MSSSDAANNTDSMDHSWLLKINEVSSTDGNNEIPKDMPDFLVTYDNPSRCSNIDKELVKESVKVFIIYE